MIGIPVGARTITRKLGEGTFAEVWLAESPHDRVAVKVLKPEWARDAGLVERFRNEWHCADQLKDCEHIVRVQDALELHGCPALVMEYIDGPTLEQRIARENGRGLALDTALAYAHDIAYALAFAHQRGVCHRDVKPSNCLLARDSERVFLTDFGIAQRSGGKRLTRAGDRLGTYLYMAPEVVRGSGIHAVPASDVYAVGVILFEMLTGTLPFDADDDYAVQQLIVEADVPALSAYRSDLPVEVETVILKCLSKQPGERLADGSVLCTTLDALRTHLGHFQAAPTPSPASHAGAVLVDLRDPLHPRSHPIPPRGLQIGADAANDLVVDHPKVSGHHVLVAPAGENRFVLSDRSSNGTWLGGQKVHHETMTIEDGEMFYLGRVAALRFLLLCL